VVALLSAPVWTGGPLATEPIALTLLAVLYIGWFLGHALLLHRLGNGDALVLVLVGVTWVGETMAYLVGSTLGRHRLAPAISPKKTIEGAVAQLICSVAAAVLLGAWLLPSWTPARAGLAGALLGVTGQLGDLAESAIKRSVGVKDTGGLIPGHGGVLDRIDGLLFNVPALYYYVRLGAAA
jgi:phosphatidate cytidylyltransferase